MIGLPVIPEEQRTRPKATRWSCGERRRILEGKVVGGEDGMNDST